MKSFAQLVSIGLIAMVGLVGLSGCGGSKPEEDLGVDYTGRENYDEIEQLLGITADDRKDTSGDDNLLELLNENEGEAATTPVTKNNMPPAKPLENPSALAEVDELKKEIRDKNKTISMLRAQVLAMEEENSQPGSSANRAVSTLPMTSMSATTSDGEYKRVYQNGFDLFQNRQYGEALQVFESLLASSTTNSLSDNAQYWIGECYYMTGDYDAAIMAFEKVFTFKNSNKNDYAQYKLGLCYYAKRESQKAREEFQSLIDNYSNELLIQKAQQKLAQL